jgi:hypothetical protein
MEKADLLHPVEAADQVSQDAIGAGLIAMQLLMLVGGNEQHPRRRGKMGGSGQKVAGAHVGKIEVQPQPARAIGYRRSTLSSSGDPSGWKRNAQTSPARGFA